MKINVRRGFTLPEILVTVTVVAVLAAVVVPAVTQYVNKGNAPATSGDISAVRQAVTSFVSDTRHYPVSFSDLVNAPAGIATWKGPYFQAALSGVSGTSATFISNGASITLGPLFTQNATNHTGFLTTTVALGTNATCQDLWSLKAIIDGNQATMADAGANYNTGSLQFPNTPCTTSATSSTSASGMSPIILRVTSIGQ